MMDTPTTYWVIVVLSVLNIASVMVYTSLDKCFPQKGQPKGPFVAIEDRLFDIAGRTPYHMVVVSGFFLLSGFLVVFTVSLLWVHLWA